MSQRGDSSAIEPALARTIYRVYKKLKSEDLLGGLKLARSLAPGQPRKMIEPVARPMPGPFSTFQHEPR